MKILVCGGRKFDNPELVARVLGEYGDDTEICHGGARGADTQAGEYARSRKWPVKVYTAAWHVYGPPAGPKRNQHMLEDFKPDLVVAFYGATGTSDMITRALKAKVPVRDVGMEK